MNSLQLEKLLLAKKFARTVSDGQSVGIVVRYVGTAPSATLQISGGNLLFKVGAPGSEVADVNVQIGATPGTIDVSQTAANNFGKLVDYINGVKDSAGNYPYQAYLQDVLRGDATFPGSAAALTTAAAIEINRTVVPTGVAFTLITANVLYISKRITPRVFPRGFNAPVPGTSAICELDALVAKNTFGSGTNTIQVWEVNPVAATETLIYSRAGAATTVEFSTDANSLGMQSEAGSDLLVREVGSAAMTGYLSVVGKVAL